METIRDNKDVMEQSAEVLAQNIDIPDGPNVAPSPQEHLAAQGIVPPAVHSAAGHAAINASPAAGAPAPGRQDAGEPAGSSEPGQGDPAAND